MDPNVLQQYLDFADKNNLFPDPNRFSSGFGFQPTQFNTKMMAANWAANMAGGNGGAPSKMPDYFAAASAAPHPAGVQIGDNPYTPHAAAMQTDPFASQPNRGQVTNYLARLLK